MKHVNYFKLAKLCDKLAQDLELEPNLRLYNNSIWKYQRTNLCYLIGCMLNELGYKSYSEYIWCIDNFLNDPNYMAYYGRWFYTLETKSNNIHIVNDNTLIIIWNLKIISRELKNKGRKLMKEYRDSNARTPSN